MEISTRLLAVAVAMIFAGAAPVVADDGTARGAASLSGSTHDEGMTRNAGSELEEESYTDDSEYEEPEYEEETPEYEQDLTTQKKQEAPVTPLYDTTTSSSAAAARPEETKATDANAGQSSKVFPDVSNAQASTDMKPHIGLLAGYNNVNGAPNGNVGFGADVGFFPIDPVSLGAEITYSPSDVDVNGLSANYDTTNYLLRAYYHLGSDIRIVKDTYLGWKAGLTRYSRVTDNTTDFSFGPVLGMNFQLDKARKVTLGPEASYLFVLGSSAPDQFALNGALRYWF